MTLFVIIGIAYLIAVPAAFFIALGTRRKLDLLDHDVSMLGGTARQLKNRLNDIDSESAKPANNQSDTGLDVPDTKEPSMSVALTDPPGASREKPDDFGPASPMKTVQDRQLMNGHQTRPTGPNQYDLTRAIKKPSRPKINARKISATSKKIFRQNG